MITQSYNFHQYRPLYKMRCDIKKLKVKLAAEIMKKVKPLMWESGFVTGGFGDKSRPIWLFAFDNDKFYKIKGSITHNLEFCGFTDKGCIITDAYMGIATMSMEDLPIEDLFKLHYWVMSDRYKHFKTQTK